jgi:deoxyribodipyrimidine photo-lyase
VIHDLQLVWFKRDLRLVDHQPLARALARGPVLPLYIVEPEFWSQPDCSARQWAFCRESLQDLQEAFADVGQPLIIRSGDAVDVLERARRQLGIAALWSHEETGNAWTFARDRRVTAWARERGIPWHELPQFGVVRRLQTRRGWARRWEERMGEAITPAPIGLTSLPGIAPGDLPTNDALALQADPCPYRQRGGRRLGLQELDDFLAHRVQRYCRSISSPNLAFKGCSRLSAYITWGCLSMREVLQRSREFQGRGVSSFSSRLHWHCHFIQKLEDQPPIEWEDFHPFMRGIRSLNDDRFAAWAEGKTGVPFVDACMRALRAHGWINFRMRAMLMSFASYNLWLPWRETGLHLARQFVDYEPGIHWSQCQMQSGSTSINTIRIYNPIKQGLDHDPDGAFIRRWCPELEDVPAVHLHEPWSLGGARAMPIVDCALSAREAKERIFEIRRSAGFDRHADAIQQRHGSRRSGLPATRRRRSSRLTTDPGIEQLALDL